MIKENVQQLSNIQKRIGALVLVVFACLAAYSFLRCFCFKVDSTDHTKKNDNNVRLNIPGEITTIPIDNVEDRTSNETDLKEDQTTSKIPNESQNSDEDSITLLSMDNEDDDFSYNEYEERTKNKKAEAFFINGKWISLRTLKTLSMIEKKLAEKNKICGKAIDNGDCFWDAFAQALSRVLGKNITNKDLREKVSQEVHRLDKGPEEENWVKKMMKTDPMDTYEDYRDCVAFTCDENKKIGKLPVWGQEKRDGVIICNLYQVNLKVYGAGLLDEDGSLDDENNFYTQEDDYPNEQPYPQTVEIAIYPGHFVPVYDA